MLELYWTKNTDVHGKVEILLERRLGKNFNIKRNENGKPYVDGNPLYFSISHSACDAVIALCDKPVGIDLESREKNRNYTHVLSSFTEREKSWIDCEPALFLSNWTAKEAYIKMLGGTLAHYLKRLEYVDGSLRLDGKDVECGYGVFTHFSAGIYAVCAEGYTNEQLSKITLKLL